MYLKSLEIAGFKSFAKKSVLTFDTSISSIVGPNGSGKSNLAEAFRFVLGEQSIKSMRGKKGEDLIYSGHNESSRINRAYVKVTFDNTKRLFDLDFDEVVIERVVHRDGINEYLLNGSNVRLKDVSELLAHAHIGSTGHHIISQGEADRILSSTIYERREIVEDALGLKVYQYKKVESQKNLEKTEANMKEVELQRREIAPHLRFLRKQMEKVDKARALKDELKDLYKTYLSRERFFIKTEKNKINEEKESPQKELEFLLKNVEQKEHSDDSDQKEKVQIHQSLQDVEREIKDLQRQRQEKNKILGSLEGKKAVYDGMRKNEEEKLVSISLVKNLAKNIEDKIKEISSLDDLKNIINSVFSNFFNENTKEIITENFEKEIEILNSELRNLQDEENKKYEIKNQLLGRLNDLDRTEKEKESEKYRSMGRINELKAVLRDFESRMRFVEQIEKEFEIQLKEAYFFIGREVADYEEVFAYEERNVQDERRRNIEKLKIRIEENSVGNGDEIVKEHKDTEERDNFLAKELEDLEKAKNAALELIKDLDQKIEVEFKEGMLRVNLQFKNFFSIMFGGGEASLNLVEDGKGIDINVSLPKKKVKGLMMLSGGERALTSIALLFALSQVKPPPFIILDETDAALDEANSRKYGDMIESLSAYSQLILITHNRETMSRAGSIFGVTMGADGGSRLLSIKFEEAVKVAK